VTPYLHWGLIHAAKYTNTPISVRLKAYRDNMCPIWKAYHFQNVILYLQLYKDVLYAPEYNNVLSTADYYVLRGAEGVVRSNKNDIWHIIEILYYYVMIYVTHGYSCSLLIHLVVINIESGVHFRRQESRTRFPGTEIVGTPQPLRQPPATRVQSGGRYNSLL